MESRHTVNRSLPYWLALCLAFSALGLASLQFFHSRAEQLRSAAEDQANSDLRLLRSFVQGALKDQDYQSIAGTLREWGQLRRDIAEIRVEAANGFVIGHFRRQHPAEHGLKLQAAVPYSYKGLANLELHTDQTLLEQAITQIGFAVTATAAALGIAAWALIWGLFRRRHQSATLQLRAEQLKQANHRALQANSDTLRMRAYLDNILDCIPSVLIGVNTQRRITEWNKGAEDSTHIKGEDARGLDLTELMPQLGTQLPKIDDAIRSGQPERTSRVTTVAGGTVRYSDIMIYPMSGETGHGALIRIDDVTQRVRFEQMMVQTEKMMSLSGLAAGVAHEINSPLSGVLQNCQNVLRRLSGDLPGNRQVADKLGLDLNLLQHYLRRRKIPEFLDMIREAAERASHIVSDMLAFSRRNGQGQEKVLVEDLAESALRLAASDYDMKKNYNFRRIELIRDFAPGLPLLHCDRPRIEQVLLNLIKNAAQAMAIDDTPQPRRITLRTRRNQDWLLIEVEDNGPGMTEEVCQRVFEPFFTTKGAGVGTGLGLSVSYFIVKEQHQGDIQVISAPGQGSRFEIRLPIQSNQLQESPGFSATA